MIPAVRWLQTQTPQTPSVTVLLHSVMLEDWIRIEIAADPIARTIKFRLDENTNTHTPTHPSFVGTESIADNLDNAMADLMLSACGGVRLSYKLTAVELLDWWPSAFRKQNSNILTHNDSAKWSATWNGGKNVRRLNIEFTQHVIKKTLIIIIIIKVRMESVRNRIFCTIRVWVSEVRSECTLRRSLPSSPHHFGLALVHVVSFFNLSTPGRTGHKDSSNNGQDMKVQTGTEHDCI